MYIGLHVKCPIFLSDFNGNLIFLDRFSKNNQIPNFMQIRSLGAELSCPPGQTDVTNLIERLSKHGESLKSRNLIDFFAIFPKHLKS
jgi:hypothetical protein